MVNPTKSMSAADVDAAPVECAEIDTLLSTCEVALNASDIAVVVPPCAEDGVFKPSNSHSALGAVAVRRHWPINASTLRQAGRTHLAKALLNIPVVAAAVTVALAAGQAARAQTTPAHGRATTGANDDTAAVRRVLSLYEAALNASDTGAVMPLYAEDGVFMPPFSESAVGTIAVRQAYDAVFKNIKLSVKFRVAEVIQMAPDWAFARTNSAGSVTVHASGAKSAEANQELFIFKKSADGTWKIARYSFSPTNPPRP